ncbi:hypothetical protein C8J56DRAFT_972167 [Mycena floridula]|nr:hypothetical protein C8J56DRAFT_972167 [Mycena floridula]
MDNNDQPTSTTSLLALIQSLQDQSRKQQQRSDEQQQRSDERQQRSDEQQQKLKQRLDEHDRKLHILQQRVDLCLPTTITLALSMLLKNLVRLLHWERMSKNPVTIALARRLDGFLEFDRRQNQKAGHGEYNVLEGSQRALIMHQQLALRQRNPPKRPQAPQAAPTDGSESPGSQPDHAEIYRKQLDEFNQQKNADREKEKFVTSYCSGALHKVKYPPAELTAVLREMNKKLPNKKSSNKKNFARVKEKHTLIKPEALEKYTTISTARNTVAHRLRVKDLASLINGYFDSAIPTQHDPQMELLAQLFEAVLGYPASEAEKKGEMDLELFNDGSDMSSSGSGTSIFSAFSSLSDSTSFTLDDETCRSFESIVV